MIKKVLIGLTGFGLFIVSGFQSCTFQSEEEYFNLNRDTTPCDTFSIGYSDLTYIFTGICANCHNSNFTYRPGIVMDSYENVKNSFATGKVLPAIKHEGIYKMPKNLNKLTDCEIQKIEAWLKNNMPEE